jgi:hypothetical protein
VAGGSDGTGKILASAELYDPNTGSFSPAGSMTTARYGQMATPLLDGRVFIAGGLDGPYYTDELASAEIYTP